MSNLIGNITRFFAVTLWQDLPAKSGLVWRWLINILRVSYIVIHELTIGELNLRAMSLVFTTLLSLVPLIAVAFSVLKAFGVHNKIEPTLLSVLEPLGPKGPEITANIIGFVQNVDVKVLGSVGVLLLLYTIVALIQKIENAFNFVWRVKKTRTLARRFTDYLSVVMIGPALVFSALGLAATVMSHEVVAHLQAIEPFGTLILYASKLTPYFMIILAFTFLYKFIPNTQVKIGAAMIGAVVAGVLWITLGKLFASFVASSSNYTAIYSGFAVLFFFMLWLYLAWLIMLTGSQVAYYLQYPKQVRFGGQDYRLSPRLRDKEGLWLMTVMAKQFYLQKPALSVHDLELKTGLASDLTQDLLTIFEQGKLIVELEGDMPCYQLAQDIAQIKVKTVLTILRVAEEAKTTVTTRQVGVQIEQLLQKLNKAEDDMLADLNLRELVISEIE